MRGLKYPDFDIKVGNKWSHRSRGAWIEIYLYPHTNAAVKSHRSRGAWIEIVQTAFHEWAGGESHRSRGAWIEIKMSL